MRPWSRAALHGAMLGAWWVLCLSCFLMLNWYDAGATPAETTRLQDWFPWDELWTRWAKSHGLVALAPMHRGALALVGLGAIGGCLLVGLSRLLRADVHGLSQGIFAYATKARYVVRFALSVMLLWAVAHALDVTGVLEKAFWDLAILAFGVLLFVWLAFSVLNRDVLERDDAAGWWRPRRRSLTVLLCALGLLLLGAAFSNLPALVPFIDAAMMKPGAGPNPLRTWSLHAAALIASFLLEAVWTFALLSLWIDKRSCRDLVAGLREICSWQAVSAYALWTVRVYVALAWLAPVLFLPAVWLVYVAPQLSIGLRASLLPESPLQSLVTDASLVASDLLQYVVVALMPWYFIAQGRLVARVLPSRGARDRS